MAIHYKYAFVIDTFKFPQLAYF